MKNTTMKKIGSRFIALLLVVATLFSLAISAFAVDQVNCQATASVFGGKSVYFYFKANSTSCKLKLTCGKGNLDWAGEGLMPTANVRGAYEIKVYKWNKNTGKITGSCILDKDIYNKSSYTTPAIRTERGSFYRVQVYFWNATTTAKSYWKNHIISGTKTLLSIDGVWPGYFGDSEWVKFPSIKATNETGCNLYSSCP